MLCFDLGVPCHCVLIDFKKTGVIAAVDNVEENEFVDSGELPEPRIVPFAGFGESLHPVELLNGQGRRCLCGTRM